MRWDRGLAVFLACQAIGMGDARAQRGTSVLPPIPLESLGPGAFDARSFDPLARRAPAAGMPQPGIPAPAMPPLQDSARQDPPGGALKPPADPAGEPEWSGGPEALGEIRPGPRFLPLLTPMPRMMVPLPGGSASPEGTRPFFSQGWTNDGFGGTR